MTEAVSKVFVVRVDYSGWSRGQEVYEVAAVSEEAAKDIWYTGKQIYTDTHKDDFEYEVDTVVEKTYD